MFKLLILERNAHLLMHSLVDSCVCSNPDGTGNPTEHPARALHSPTLVLSWAKDLLFQQYLAESLLVAGIKALGEE